jgi:hypothetical protein
MTKAIKYYSTLTALPRASVGDRVFRRTLVGQYEEALIVSIMSAEPDSENWSATLMTKNGVEHVNGNVEHRTVHDWMPVGWVYDKEAVVWIPPQEMLRDDSKEVELEDPVEAEKIAESAVFVVPSPWDGEKYMSWRSRVLKSVPALKGAPSIFSKLSESWKQKNYEIIL